MMWESRKAEGLSGRGRSTSVPPRKRSELMERLSLWKYFVHDWLLSAREWCERIIYCHHNARVLAEMEWRLGCVLNHCTRGMSKPYYTLDDMRKEIDLYVSDLIDEALADEMEPLQNPRPLAEWHEDYGPVLWWTFPVNEPPYAGTPLDSDWPGYPAGERAAYLTHWTEIPEPTEPTHVVAV